MKKKEMFFPVDDEIFLPTDLKGTLQKHVDEYNAIQSAEPDKLMGIVHKLISWHNVTLEEAVALKNREIVQELTSWCHGLYLPYEFGGDLSILMFAIEGRHSKKLAWGASALSAFYGGELEICRELVFREMLEYSKSDVMNANGAYKQLIKETADDNTADILGMITDELGDIEKISDDDFGELLDDFGALIAQWRALEVPKCRDEDAYELVYELIERCFEHKAYRSAIRLSGLLYASDEPKKLPNLAKTSMLMGKVMYEVGSMEIAKRCFMLADEETKGKCWEGVPEKYRELLNRETKLEISEAVLKAQKNIDELVASGKFKLYTEKEVDKYFDGELEDVEFLDLKKQQKERAKIGEKAIKAYEKNKSVEEALAVFTEEPEVYEQAAYLYFMQANAYLDEDDLDNALAAIKKAYNCKNGKINGMVLLTFAIVLSKMGRYNEANIYIFRAYILFGKDFIADKLGEGALEAIEDYL